VATRVERAVVTTQPTQVERVEGRQPSAGESVNVSRLVGVRLQNIVDFCVYHTSTQWSPVL